MLTPLYEPNEAKSIVRMVFEMRFGLSFTDILCGKDTQISEEERADLQKIVERLLNGEPVQYVLQQADFASYVFQVGSGVLIPRPETEDLCLWIEAHLSLFSNTKMQLLDIGTGSGCIAITMKKKMNEGYVEAWDISQQALFIAQQNAKRLQAPITLQQTDVLNAPHHTHKWHIIVSNPPYIMQKEQTDMEPHVLNYEPHTALFVPNNNPLLFYKAIAKYAQTALQAGGFLFFEITPLLCNEMIAMLKEHGFVHIEVKEDRFGKQRMIKAQQP